MATQRHRRREPLAGPDHGSRHRRAPAGPVRRACRRTPAPRAVGVGVPGARHRPRSSRRPRAHASPGAAATRTDAPDRAGVRPDLGGDLAEAEVNLTTAATMSRTRGFTTLRAAALSHLAMTLHMQGRERASADVADEVRDLLAEHAWSPVFLEARAELARDLARLNDATHERCSAPGGATSPAPERAKPVRRHRPLHDGDPLGQSGTGSGPLARRCRPDRSPVRSRSCCCRCRRWPSRSTCASSCSWSTGSWPASPATSTPSCHSSRSSVEWQESGLVAGEAGQEPVLHEQDDAHGAPRASVDSGSSSSCSRTGDRSRRHTSRAARIRCRTHEGVRHPRSARRGRGPSHAQGRVLGRAAGCRAAFVSRGDSRARSRASSARASRKTGDHACSASRSRTSSATSALARSGQHVRGYGEV